MKKENIAKSDNYVPEDIVGFIKTNLNGDNASTVLEAVEDVLQLEQVYTLPPLFEKGKTEGDWIENTNWDFRKDFRPDGALSFETINEMLKNGVVRFAFEMKRAQILSVFRNERTWEIHCPDKELKEVVTANLIEILPRMAVDFTYSSMVYGTSFQELIWERKTKYELGLAPTNIDKSKYIVAKVPNAVNPETVDSIRRKINGDFNGFIQNSRKVNGKDIVVRRGAALVIPYNGMFRNLWGQSTLAPIYPLWFWYEVILRSMVKYMERVGTPVALVRAPSRSTVYKPGTTERVHGMTWGMEVASNVSRSNAIVIPSDSDEFGNPLWDLSYVSTTSSTQYSAPFQEVLELITQMILRASLSADRALSQTSGGVGSYNIGEIHREATALNNEVILIQMIQYINQYFLPHYSLYNRPQPGPPIRMETQGFDPNDRDNLTQLLSVAPQLESFKSSDAYKIDWNTLMNLNNIPVLGEDEAKKIKEKLHEESIANIEDNIKVQQRYAAEEGSQDGNSSSKSDPNTKKTDKRD